MATRNNIDVYFRIRGQLAQAFNQAAKSARQLSNALKTVDKDARRTSTGIGQITKSMERLGSSLPALIGSGGLAIALKKSADTAFQANAQMMVLRQTLRHFGEDVADGVRLLNQISEELQVAPEQAAASAALMLRAGYNMREVVEAFRAGAASALAAGKTVKSGIENVALALSTGLSIYLNYIGIAENIGPVIRRAIAAHKDAAPEIVKAAQNQAALNVVLKATAQEVKALPVLLGGYQGALNRMNVAFFNLSKTVGQEVIPGLTLAIQRLTKLLELFIALPAPVKAFTVGIGGTLVAVTSLATALAGLKVVLGIIGGPAGLIMLVVTALGGLAAVIFNSVKPAIDEGTKALERLAEATGEARKEIHKVNLIKLESLKLEAVMKAGDALAKFRSRFKELTPIAKQFYDILEKGIQSGHGVRTLQQLTESYRKLRDAGKLTLEDQRQLLKLIRSFTGPTYGALKAIDDLTKQLDAYNASAKDLLGQEPPSPQANERVEKYKNLWEEINNIPILKASYLRELNRSLGTTPDIILRNSESHATKFYENLLKSGSMDRAIVVAVNEVYRAAFEAWKTNVENQSFLQELADSYIGDLPDAAAGIEQGMRVLADDAWQAHKEAIAAKDWAITVSESFIGDLPDAEASISAGLKAILAGALNDIAADVGVRQAAENLRRVLFSAMARGSQDHAITNALRDQAMSQMKAIARVYKQAAFAMRKGGIFTLAFWDERRWGRFELTVENLFNNIPGWVKKSDGALERMREHVAKLQTTFGSVTSAVNSFFGAMKGSEGGNSKKLISGISSALASLAKLIPGIGQAISTAIQFVGSILTNLWDKITDPSGARRADRQIRKVADGFKLIGKEAFDAAKEIKTLHRWTLFGTRTSKKTVVNKELLDTITSIARALESGVNGALRSGIKAFLTGKADWARQLKDGIRDAIYNGIVEAVIQAGVIQGMLAEQFTALNKALTQQNWDAAARIARGIMDRIPDVVKSVESVLGPFTKGRVTNPTIGGQLGPGTSISYSLPNAPIVATPAWVDVMGRAVAKFDAAVDRLLEGALGNGLAFGIREVIL